MKLVGSALLISLEVLMATATSFFFPSTGVAAPEVFQRWSKLLEAQSESRRASENCNSCQTETSSKCRKYYLELFQKPQLNIFYALGYGDYNTGTANWSDALFAEAIESLTGKCKTKEDLACEFKRSNDDASTFSKTIMINGVNKTLSLRAIKASAAVSPDSPQQAIQSTKARSAFLSALTSADVVIYDGHSRDGGGPDFFPAKRTPNGKINYPYYIAKKQGITEILDALERRKNSHLPLLALISCDTRKHFMKELRRASPESRLILTNKVIRATESVPTLLWTIDSVMKQRCGTELRKSRPFSSLDMIQFD